MKKALKTVPASPRLVGVAAQSRLPAAGAASASAAGPRGGVRPLFCTCLSETEEATSQFEHRKNIFAEGAAMQF